MIGRCIVEGCGREETIRRGLCSKHYATWRRHGDPLVWIGQGGSQHPIPIEQRFWDKVEKTPYCYEWLGFRNTDGYGIIRNQNGSSVAHRVAFEMAYGPIPVGYEIDHLCRNRGCVRVDHLEAVTHKTNIQRGHNHNAAKTSCVHGHPLEGNNLIVNKRTGKRNCRECAQRFSREYQREKRKDPQVREQKRAYMRDWYERNAAYRKAYNRAYYERRRDARES